VRKQMSHKELIALARWLEAHRDQIHRERPSYGVVARQASAELGFACTENNVRAAAEACEMVWSVRRTGGAPRASGKHVSRILARAVVEIADAVGVKVGQDVHRIARGRRVTEGAPADTAHA